MIQFDKCTLVKNLTGTTVEDSWPPVAISASIPLPSVNNKARHAYLTPRGILIYCPERQMAIEWADLFALLETHAPELKGVPSVKQPIIVPTPPPTKSPK